MPCYLRLLGIACFGLCAFARNQGLSFPNFSSTAGLTLNGNGAVVNTRDGNVLRLTAAQSGESGSVFSNDRITFATGSNSFSTFFQFRITNTGVAHADGLAFVLQTAGSNVGGGEGYQSIYPSLGVEFDTYQNQFDPGNNHVSIVVNGDLSARLSVASPYGVTDCAQPAGVRGCLANGDLWSVWIDYDGTNIRVAVADHSTVRPPDLLNYRLDLTSRLYPDQTPPEGAGAFAGFTAGTRSSYENQDIVDWQYSNSYHPFPGPLLSTQPLSAGDLNLGTFPLGNPVSGSLPVSGGIPPYSFSFDGTPPPGITVNGNGISGTPAQPGNYSVTLVVTDSQKVSVSGTISFSVMGFVDAALPSGVTFSRYSATPAVAGGLPPYTFAILGLPPGLNANSGGAITGTVTAPSISKVSVTATDTTGVSISATLPLAITAPPPLRVSPSMPPDGMVGVVYSQVLSGAAGGAPPYTWSLVSGAAPDGLSLRSGGTVSGLPSRPGTFRFGVRVTDVTGASALSTVSIAIAPVPVSISTPSPLATGVATVEYPPQTISAAGGVPPYTFAVTSGALPDGVRLDANGTLSGNPSSNGNFTFTITSTDATGATGSSNLALSVRPFSTDLILSAGSLAFSLAAGSVAVPPGQTVGLQSTSTTALPGYAAAVAPAAANWLSVSPSSGGAPGAITVSLTNQALLLPASATPYEAMVTVECTGPVACGTPTQTVPVTLSVSNPPPQLSVIGDIVSFTALAGSPQAMSQTLGIQNTGGGIIGIGSVSCDASWCHVGGVPGSLFPGAVAPISITADPAGLTAGYHRANLTIRASTGVAAVPVTLFIAVAASITLQPAGAQFLALAGGVPNGGDTSFLVDVSGNAPVNWMARVLPGAPWLSLIESGGTASPTQPGTVDFAIDLPAVAGLPPNNYYGTIRVTAPGLVNSPQDFQVVLSIGPATSRQRPNPAPSGLLFISPAGSVPPPQTVQISTNSTAPVNVQASASTADGANWLSVTPASSPAAPGAPLSSQVSVNPSRLAPGVYMGGVSYAYTSIGVRTVNVTLVVTVAPRPAANHVSGSGSGRPAAASCTPGRIVVAQTGLVGSFATPTAWPTPLLVQLLDDCGTPVTNGQIAATFSNGDPPLALHLADGSMGLYAGTWTPRRASGQVTISTRATAPGFEPVTTLLAGSVTPNAAPLLARNSTLHVFNPLAGAALAPGTLVQISGSALAAGKVTASGAPLPTSLNGTQVLIGGIPAPIASVSPGVLNAQIPFELSADMQYQVVVSANGALTTPDTIQIVNTSPGVFTAASGLATVMHADGSAVTEAAPASPGEALTMIAAGLGLTDTPVGSGTAAPAAPVANALSTPSLTISDEPAFITFAGLQPGMVGVYQIAFVVPDDAREGDLTLVLSQEGQPGNAAVLAVKRKM